MNAYRHSPKAIRVVLFESEANDESRQVLDIIEAKNVSTLADLMRDQIEPYLDEIGELVIEPAGFTLDQLDISVEDAISQMIDEESHTHAIVLENPLGQHVRERSATANEIATEFYSYDGNVYQKSHSRYGSITHQNHFYVQIESKELF